MYPRKRALWRHQNLLRIRLRIWRLIRVQLLRQLLYMRQQSARILHFNPQQLPQITVQLVPNVTGAPWWPPLRHETRKKHTVQDARRKITIFQVSLAEKRRLVERDHRFGVDADDC